MATSLSETVGRPVKSFSDACVLQGGENKRKIFKNDASVLETTKSTLVLEWVGGGHERKGGFM